MACLTEWKVLNRKSDPPQTVQSPCNTVADPFINKYKRKYKINHKTAKHEKKHLKIQILSVKIQT